MIGYNFKFKLQEETDAYPFLKITFYVSIEKLQKKNYRK